MTYFILLRTFDNEHKLFFLGMTFGKCSKQMSTKLGSEDGNNETAVALLTDEEIIAAFNTLPDHDAPQVVALIRSRELLPQDSNNEINLATLKPSTLLEVQQFIWSIMQKNQQEESSNVSQEESKEESYLNFIVDNSTLEHSWTGSGFQESLRLPSETTEMFMLHETTEPHANEITEIIVGGPQLNYNKFIENDVLLSTSGTNASGEKFVQPEVVLTCKYKKVISPQPGPSKKLNYNDSSDSSSEEELDGPDKTDSGQDKE